MDVSTWKNKVAHANAGVYSFMDQSRVDPRVDARVEVSTHMQELTIGNLYA